MDALLIRETRQEEVLYSLEERMKRMEIVLQAAGVMPLSESANTTPKEALMSLISQHTSEEDLRQAVFDLDVDGENFPAGGKMALARELYRELKNQSRLYMLVGWLHRRVPNVHWPSV